MTFEQVLKELNQTVEMYSDVIEDYDKVEEYCDDLREKYDELNKKLASAQATIKYLSAKIYAPKSEKTAYIDYENSFFALLDEEIFRPSEPQVQEETVEVASYRRPKAKGHKEQILRDFPHEKVVSDIPEEDRVCDRCGSELAEVGEEFVRSEVIIEPPRISVIDHYVKTYECRACRKDDGKAHMIRPQVPEALISHSFASASLAGAIIHNKFALGLPLYRQEKEWEALGLALGRETMSNWMMILVRDWLHHITDRLRTELLSQGYIHADETPMQVLNEKDRDNRTKSYFWAYASIEGNAHPVRLFVYEPGRSGDYPAGFLSGFSGTIITDAYNGYRKVPDVQRALCWAHARREYTDALPKGKVTERDSVAATGAAYISRIFETEGKLSELTAEERLDKRKELIGPILEAYWSWVVESIGKTMPKTKAAKALAYSLNNKDGLMKFMEDGQIPLSNNIAENSIRPIVIGRKNFLFCGSPAGATATAAIYSIVESAKANGLDPRKYVVRLLEEMPKIGYDKCKKEVDRLMPWAAEIQSTCR